jgi:hypothetical protein
MRGTVAGVSRARMAELVDAPASGAGAGNGVEVRVLFRAPIFNLSVVFFLCLVGNLHALFDCRHPLTGEVRVLFRAPISPRSICARKVFVADFVRGRAPFSLRSDDARQVVRFGPRPGAGTILAAFK